MNDPEPVLPEPTKVTVWCNECQQVTVVNDIHAFILGLHQRVCGELENINGTAE